MSFIGGRWSEPELIGLAYEFEQATHVRVPPQFLPTIGAASTKHAHVVPAKSGASAPVGFARWGLRLASPKAKPNRQGRTVKVPVMPSVAWPSMVPQEVVLAAGTPLTTNAADIWTSIRELTASGTLVTRSAAYWSGCRSIAMSWAACSRS